MKEILAIDLDGALLKSRPFDVTHKRWFEVLAILLKDESIKKYAGLDNYFDKVHEVMERYLGDVDHETRVKFARNLFAMATVAEVTKDDLVKDFAKYLKSLKKKYKLALITSAPATSVEPILHKVDCLDLFDIVYKSPVNRHPDKKELFKEFIKKYSKPKFYIGNGNGDIKNCKDLRIPTISVNWVVKGELKGDYDVNKVSELNEIFNQ